MSDQVFIYTMNQGGTIGKWSRYVFPFIIQWFAHFKDDLYLRAGDVVYKVDEKAQDDDGVVFNSVIQWPWLDFRKPGVDKMLTGFDVVCDGAFSIEVGYNQADKNAFTDPFDVPGDTLTGQIIPLPVTAPTMSIRLTYQSDQSWIWEAMQLYVQDMEVAK